MHTLALHAPTVALHKWEPKSCSGRDGKGYQFAEYWWYHSRSIKPKKSFHQFKTLVAYRYRVLGPVQDVCHLKLAQVEWQNKKYTYFFTYCGTKGDWPFLRSALGLNCGYNCLRKCHRCDIADTWLNQFCPQNLSFPISKVPPSLRNIVFVNPSCPVVRR